VITSLQRVCSKVPDRAECGIHLCYGDQRAKHFVEPRDASKMVEFANAIAAAVARPINYFHMPVPIDRSDEAFFRPLADLKVRDAGLYLGLVHADGEAKVQERIAAAQRFVRSFGIATECGIARSRREDLVMKLLSAHRLGSSVERAA
jgi:methionine synthase II (cobalamin-independent)